MDDRLRGFLDEIDDVLMRADLIGQGNAVWDVLTALRSLDTRPMDSGPDYAATPANATANTADQGAITTTTFNDSTATIDNNRSKETTHE